MGMSTYRVHVDGDACCGHGRCYDLAPQLFDADDQGHSVVQHDIIDDELLVAADRAAAACPERAITVARVAEARSS
jgi:ferredoxin